MNELNENTQNNLGNEHDMFQNELLFDRQNNIGLNSNNVFRVIPNNQINDHNIQEINVPIISINNSSSIISEIKSLFFTRKCHLISLVVILINCALIYYILLPKKIDESFLSNLESNSRHTWIILWLINIMLIILIWNLYLLLYKSILKYEYTPGNGNIKTSLVENLYRNPFLFILMLSHLDSSFLKNKIDDSFWILVTSVYFFMNFNLVQIYKNFDKEISSISNFSSNTTKSLIRKIKLVSFLFCLLNIVFTVFVYYISESGHNFKTHIYDKGIYLFIKILELYVTRRNSFYFIQYDVTEKEKFLIRNLNIKTTMEMLSIVFILGEMLRLYFFCESDKILFQLTYLILILIQIYSTYSYLKKYVLLKKYYKHLDEMLVKKNAENEECIICTERLKEGRLLPCKHMFHLICITQWLEKGNKTCPICRSQIKIKIHPENERRFSSYGIRINNSFFSWLPSLSMRIVRMRNVNDN